MIRPRRSSVWILLLLCCGLLFPTVLSAQTGNRLARLQDEAREYLRSLQSQMESLAQRLETEQPDDSSRLRLARERIVRELIEDDMRAVAEALEKDDYVIALETIRQVRSNLQTVLAILEARDVDPEQLANRLDEVASRLQAIGEITDQQRSLRDRTAVAEQAGQDVQDLEDVQSNITDLLRDQQQLSRTEDSRIENRSAQEAQEISRDAQNIADDLTREARRQQGISNVVQRVKRIQAEVQHDAETSSALGSQSESGAIAARERLAQRARQQAAAARQTAQSIEALRRESAQDADLGDESARQVVEELARALEAMQQSASAADSVVKSMEEAGSGEQQRKQQQSALQSTLDSLKRASDSDGSRVTGLQQRLEDLRAGLSDWMDRQRVGWNPAAEQDASSASEDLEEASRALDRAQEIGENSSSATRQSTGQQSGQPSG
ncbi:MAG TPA: hypothetical protein EYO84_07895, partial [Planctomycetes bacterium]|nr:hypothetical protein [Planctomycetota bacterium]